MKNKETPLVSVIASCYNQSPYLIETLESIKKQTYKNLQLIMWDDCSTDNSVELIEKWISDNQVDCVFLKHKKNMGICKSLNEAFTYVKGKYLQTVAMDDILLPDKIERHVEMMENSSQKDALVFSNAHLIDEKSGFYQNKFIAYTYHKNYLSLQSGNYYQMLLQANFIPAMSILYKTQVIKQLGGWDEKLKYEDYDMLLRIAQKYDFIYDDNYSVKYRIVSNGLNSKLTESASFSYEDAKVYLKHLEEPIANNFLKNFLIKLYYSKSEELDYFRKEYFIRKETQGFSLFCVKNSIPLWIHKIHRIVKNSLYIIKNNKIY
ncbi:MAG: glycosyltransferase [Prevotellaceae bacterium]|jgi:glycosyltransferase involved in cell wall biosynthesis|nr:glycosyltransferase [Prevotellaceae bacterium]